MSIDMELNELFARYEATFTDYDGIEIKDVNQLGLGEDRLLHLAANHSNYQDVELLLKNGADVNTKGDIGLTALHYAASKGKLDIVNLLLQYGADKKIKNEFDETAADWAKNSGYMQIYKILS